MAPNPVNETSGHLARDTPFPYLHLHFLVGAPRPLDTTTLYD
jgi:hypothetical protein